MLKLFNRSLVLVVSAIGLLGANLAFASDNQSQVGRYLMVANHPLQSQAHLLQQNFHVRFADDVQTVGQAIHYLLTNSGYQLQNPSKQNNAMKTLMDLPLPFIDRDFGPMSLEEGLITLAGESFQLLVDPVHRDIGFRLKSNYEHFVDHEVKKSETR